MKHPTVPERFPFVQGTMAVESMKTCHSGRVESWNVHAHLCRRNEYSIVRCSYFITFIDEASGHVKAMHVRTKGKEQSY